MDDSHDDDITDDDTNDYDSDHYKGEDGNVCLDLVKVSDDLVEEAQTLQSVLVHAALVVELLELRHGGEHDAHTVT